MAFWRRITDWLGITAPRWMHAAIANRNLPVVAIGSIVVALFAAMLAFCLITNTPCPIDGFDEAAYETPQATQRYTVTITTVFFILVAISIFSVMYLRKRWEMPRTATAVTALFAFIVAMLWGLAESGLSVDKQILIFASIEFLVAGLIIFTPLFSLVFFAATFALFGASVVLSGQLGEGMVSDFVYLASLDVIVCWVVYGMFARATRQQHEIVEISRRDELTGAKNRHYLREDFTIHFDVETFIMLCDIDNFKQYNDNFDHDMGDELLKQFFYALREAFGDECTYRYGGDEFLIVSDEFGKEEFEHKLEKVRKQLARVTLDGKHIELTYSGGFVRGTASDNESFRAMLHEADQNLLEAKRRGKNQIVG